MLELRDFRAVAVSLLQTLPRLCVQYLLSSSLALINSKLNKRTKQGQ